MQTGARGAVGILGGMGPLATSTFYGLLVGSTPAAKDQDHIRIIINSDPTIPDRTAYLLGKGPDPRPSLIAGAKLLKRAGAGQIVIPCNTANVFQKEIEHAARITVVPWLDLAVDAVQRLGSYPIGILATTGTVAASVYQDRLKERGIPYIIPCVALQEQVMDVIYGPHGVKTTGKRTVRASRALRGIADEMKAVGAQSLLLACTELPIAVDAMLELALPHIDPAICVTDQIVRELKGDSNAV